mmetsp:Transcript_53225/g.121669  ORF Transcript_53225/g.121669 Transcript_53225/m.121669 type:complete len:278 (-) Transcript_53225:1015-1848(-)
MTRAPCASVDTSVGMLAPARGISSNFKDGTLASSSGGSSADCACLNFSTCSVSIFIPLSSRPALAAANRSLSAASRAAPASRLGVVSTVTRWGLSNRYFLIIVWKTGSSAANRCLMLSSGFWKWRVVNGSPSYIQSRTAASIKASPFGKVPVFCSRNMNSRLFTAAATASVSNPSRASCCNVLNTISSTFAEFSGATLSKPTLNTCWRSVSSRPPPMTWAPNPLSISAFCNGLPLLPRRRLPSRLRANFSSAVCASPGVKSQLTLQIVFLLMSESSR